MTKNTLISTVELTAELSKREGIRTLSIEPYQEVKITTGHETITFTGPAMILINQD